MCNRGLKTLQIRMKQHFHNALAVARFLESNSRVEKVIFPGKVAGLGVRLGVRTVTPRAVCAPFAFGDSGLGVRLGHGCRVGCSPL